MGLPVPLDRRNAIVQAAIEDIRNGISTEIIGAKHGVSGACIRQWLITDAQPETDQARAEFVSSKMMEAIDSIDVSQDAVSLARAREQFKSWSWLAERRVPNLFGQKQEITHKHDISDDLRAMSERRRQAQATRDSVQVIEDAQIISESTLKRD